MRLRHMIFGGLMVAALLMLMNFLPMATGAQSYDATDQAAIGMLDATDEAKLDVGDRNLCRRYPDLCCPGCLTTGPAVDSPASGPVLLLSMLDHRSSGPALGVTVMHAARPAKNCMSCHDASEKLEPRFDSVGHLLDRPTLPLRSAVLRV